MFSLLKNAKHTRMLGVDISPSTVKLIELCMTDGNRYHVEAYSIMMLPQNAIIETNVNNVAEVANTLRNAHIQARTTNKLVCAAVANSSVITKVLSVPAGLKNDDLKAQLTLEADQYIPYPLEEIIIDFEVQGPTNGCADMVDVLLTACRCETIATRVEAFKGAGLKAKVIDVETYAVERVFDLIRAQAGIDKQAIVAIVDIGATMTILSVIHRGKTVYTHEQLFGGRQLTDEIMHRYDLLFSEADLAKKQGDLPDNYESEILGPFRENVVQQLTRSLQFFFSSSGFSAVDYIVLAGGVAATNGLANLVSKRLATPVVVANPFTDMTISSQVNAVALERDAPRMMVACGLALRSFV